MPRTPEKRWATDPVKKELEASSISPPKAVEDQSCRDSQIVDIRVIPQPFLDAILEVIAKSIEQALADVMARCVGEAIQQAIRPLSLEIGFMRVAIEHNWGTDISPRPEKLSEKGSSS